MSVTAVERPAHLDKPWTAHEVLRGLFFHLVQQGYAPLTEVSTPPSRPWRPHAEIRRRIDMLAIRQQPEPSDLQHRYPDGLELFALEVKVTRRDFLNDARNPAKQHPWRTLASQHVYVAPAGLIQSHEIPVGSGLLEAHRLPDYPNAPAQVRTVCHPPYNLDRPPIPTWLIHAIASSAAWSEAYRKGLNP